MHTLRWHHFLGYVYTPNPTHTDAFVLYRLDRQFRFSSTAYFWLCYTPPHSLQYASDGGHEAVEDLLLLLSLTFEDYALSLEPGTEPTQGAVAFLVTMVAGLPVTMLRLTALTEPESATVMNHTGSGAATVVHHDVEH